MATIYCLNEECPSGGEFQSDEQFPSRRLCRLCREMRRRLLTMSGPGTVSKPPTIARSAVAPAIRAAIEADRANPQPLPPPIRVTEGFQRVAAEMVGDQRDRAADVLSRNVRVAVTRSLRAF
jgi:hypothetical protein